jgi:hypothetical protein
VTLTQNEALARARAADEAGAPGEWWGRFHGVPCTIKDTFETAGVRTTAGAPFLADHVPARDAVVAARLRAAGAVILGKTNVPLMAGDWQSYNDVFGTTNNPMGRSADAGWLHRWRCCGPGGRPQLRVRGQRYRWIHPCARPLLRHLRPQADTQRGALARAHSAAPRRSSEPTPVPACGRAPGAQR